jgi:hypothetical protein
MKLTSRDQLPGPVLKRPTRSHQVGPSVRIFLYLICHDFRKIIGQINIFDKCIYDAVAHGVRLLPPHPTALGPYRRAAAGVKFLSQRC